jgi:hypothetical protein
MSSPLLLFGVLIGGAVIGTTTGFVKSLYCSYPVQNATLVIGNMEFHAVYIRSEIVGENDVTVYKLIFFNDALSLPLGNLNTFTVRCEGCPDCGAVIFYQNDV